MPALARLDALIHHIATAVRPPRGRGPKAAWFLVALLASPWALADAIWIALASKDPVYIETANAIRGALPEHDVRVAEWREFNFRSASPQVLVTVGGDALANLVQHAGKTPIVATLVPRSSLDEVREGVATRVTGVYYEQPIPRLAALLREAFPSRARIGVLLGPASVRYRGELSAALLKQGLDGIFEVVRDKSELAAAAQRVLSDSDVFLALPDAEAINNQSARFILLSSYRRGVPVVGYSAAFVKAGAAVAMVSSPAQIGKEAAQMVGEIAPGRRLPPPRSPEAFEVLVNASVSRSLGLNLDSESLERQVGGTEASQ